MKRSPARSFPAALILVLCLASPVSAHPGMETRLDRINALLESNPQHPALYLQRAATYRHLRLWQLALDDLHQAELLGNPADAHAERGRVYFESGEYRRAIDSFTLYLEYHPDHAESLEYRARAAMATGDKQAALEDFHRYFSRDQDSEPGIYLLVAQLLSESGERNSAIELLDQGLERLGMIPQIQRYAVTLEVQENQLESALQRWQALEPALGSSPDWKVEKARLLILARETQLAQVLLREASEQLAQLRSTPSRRQLQERIREMSS